MSRAKALVLCETDCTNTFGENMQNICAADYQIL
jgi:hypothetical protein